MAGFVRPFFCGWQRGRARCYCSASGSGSEQFRNSERMQRQLLSVKPPTAEPMRWTRFALGSLGTIEAVAACEGNGAGESACGGACGGSGSDPGGDASWVWVSAGSAVCGASASLEPPILRQRLREAL